jgi:hypothetical protein
MSDQPITIDGAPEHSNRANAEVENGSTQVLPFFSVSTRKLIVMSVVTLGFYSSLYWHFKNWRAHAEATGEYISPKWRAIFAPLFYYSLLRRVAVVAKAHDVPFRWPPILLAGAWIIWAIGTYQLPDETWFLDLAMVLLFVPPQIAINQINRRINPDADHNDRFSWVNKIWIVIGAALLAVLLWDTVFPDDLGLFKPVIPNEQPIDETEGMIG